MHSSKLNAANKALYIRKLSKKLQIMSFLKSKLSKQCLDGGRRQPRKGARVRIGNGKGKIRRKWERARPACRETASAKRCPRAKRRRDRKTMAEVGAGTARPAGRRRVRKGARVRRGNGKGKLGRKWARAQPALSGIATSPLRIIKTCHRILSSLDKAMKEAAFSCEQQALCAGSTSWGAW